MIALFTWRRSWSIHLDGRLDSANYDFIGTVVIGYTLFALALGAIWNRAAASLAVAFVGYFAVRIFVDFKVRDHLVAPLQATYKGDQRPSFLEHAHILSMQGDLHGRQVMGGRDFFFGNTKLAAPRLNNVVFHVHHPPSHFWPLQLTETGLFLGLAAAVLAFAAWWTSTRTT